MGGEKKILEGEYEMCVVWHPCCSSQHEELWKARAGRNY